MPQPATPALFYSLPEIYDILHSPGTLGEVKGLEKIAGRFVVSRPLKDQTWLEPACGSGRYLRAAAARGRRVVGFDLEPAMVAYAKRSIRELRRRRQGRRGGRAVPAARIFMGDMTRFADHLKPASVDFAFNLINSIRHLDSDTAMLAHFRGIARVLRPGGVYAVGLSLSSYDHEIPTEDVWVGRRGRSEVKQVVQYLVPTRRKRSEPVISHLTVTRGPRTQELDFTYTLRSYDTRQWERLIARSPLKIMATVDEQGGDLAIYEPGYAIFILAPRDG
jgi:SAM-dependent methyltransferase